MSDEEQARRARLANIERILSDLGKTLTEREKEKYMTYGTFCPNAVVPPFVAIEKYREETKQAQRKRTRKRRR